MPGIFHLVEFQMSFLLFIALAGYLLASRINQSAVIGEILVGLVVGPSVLGIITYTDFVSSIAHLGAVVLLFVVGLEFRLEDIAKPKYLMIAASGVAVPWVTGYALSVLFDFSFGSSVFIATALTATSIAITANVLKEMGRLKTEAARAIIGAAVIDDVLSLLVLAVGSGLVAGALSFVSLAAVFTKAVLFLGIGAAAGHFGLRKVLALIDETKFTRRYPEIPFIFATMLAFLYGMAAELMGLSAIVGAFIAGASLAGVTLRNGRDLYHGSESLMIIFSSIFFVSLGILADIRTLDAQSPCVSRCPDRRCICFQADRLRRRRPPVPQRPQGFDDHRLRHGSPGGGGDDHRADRSRRGPDPAGRLRQYHPHEPLHYHHHSHCSAELAVQDRGRLGQEGTGTITLPVCVMGQPAWRKGRQSRSVSPFVSENDGSREQEVEDCDRDPCDSNGNPVAQDHAGDLFHLLPAALDVRTVRLDQEDAAQDDSRQGGKKVPDNEDVLPGRKDEELDHSDRRGRHSDDGLRRFIGAQVLEGSEEGHLLAEIVPGEGEACNQVCKDG